MKLTQIHQRTIMVFLTIMIIGLLWLVPPRLFGTQLFTPLIILPAFIYIAFELRKGQPCFSSWVYLQLIVTVLLLILSMFF